MVLRPNILKYKGKAQKVDSAKLDTINKRMQNAQSEIQSKKIVPKTALFIGFGACVVVMAPLLYFTLKTQSAASNIAI